MRCMLATSTHAFTRNSSECDGARLREFTLSWLEALEKEMRSFILPPLLVLIAKKVWGVLH